MTRPVDEKLVMMKMDHSDLKKKATETAGILGRLKDSLSRVGSVNVSSISKDFSSISKAANSVDMSSLGRSIDGIASRFSNMGVVATTALANIANKVTNVATSTAYSLGPAQVVDGFREYEMKMNSIGTMLANTKWEGKTLDDVKKTLGELNDYADQTVYSFAEMTRNIGRFTAAGVKLDDSAVAIKGMGNLAALSGANGEQYNRAMYQVSQALAGGVFQLIDWNSIEEASMGGKMTKDALVEVAEGMGIYIDKSKTFRDSLKDGWLTSEVFIETMKRFGNDQSMIDAATKIKTFSQMMDSLKEGIGSSWATTWEIIFGDFEYATKFWTSISNIIKPFFDKQGEARNNLLRQVFGADGKGVYGVLDALKNIFQPIKAIAGAISSAFDEVFPYAAFLTVHNLIKAFKELSTSVQMSETSTSNVQTIFIGIFSVVKILVNGLRYLGDAFLNIVPGVKAVLSGIVSLGASIFTIPIWLAKATEKTDEFSGSTGLLGKAVSGVSYVLENFGSIIANLGTGMLQSLKILKNGSFTDGPLGETSFIVDALIAMHNAFNKVVDVVSNISITETFRIISETIRGIPSDIEAAKNAIGGFFSSVWDAFMNNQGLLLAGGSFAGIVAVGWKIWEVFSAFSKPLVGFGEVLENAGDAIGAFTLGIHVKSLLTISIALGILAASFLLLSNLNSEQITSGLYMIVGSLTAMVLALTIMSKYDVTGSFGATLQIIGMSIAIAMLAGAVNRLADLKPGELTKGIISVIALLGGLAGAMVLMTKFGGPQLSVGALQFLAMAGAVMILVSAVDKLIGLDSDDLGRGLSALAAILVSMGVLVAMSSKSQFGASSGVGMIAVAFAVKMMTDAIGTLGDMDENKLKQGLGVVAGLLAGLGLVASVANKPGVLAAGTSMLIIAAAINALIIPIKVLGEMPLPTLIQGMVAIGVALVGLVAATSAATAAIPGAIAIGIIAASMNLLIVPITTLGLLPLEVVGIGLLAIVGAILGIAGASSVAAPAAPAIMAIAAALAVLSLGVGVAGWGIGQLAKGLGIFLTIFVGVAAGLVAAMTVMINGAIALMPAFTDLVMKAVDGILRAVEYSAPKVMNAFADLIITISNTIGDRSADVVGAITDMIVKVLDGLEVNIPKVINKFADMCVTIGRTLEERLPDMISAGADWIVAFLDGLETEIPRVINAMQEFAINIINGFADGLENNGGAMVDAMTRLLGEVLILMLDAGTSLVSAVFGWIPGVNEAMSAVATDAEQAIRNNFSSGEVGKEKGEEFAGGLSDTSGSAETAGAALAQSGQNGASSVSLTTTGEQFGQGFINGMGSPGILSSIWNTAKGLASRALEAVQKRLDTHSPSREAYILGDYFGQGLNNGIADNKKNVAKTSEEIAEAALTSFNNAISSADEDYDLGLLSYDAYIHELTRIRDASTKHNRILIEANRKLNEATFKQSKDWIDEELYYKRLSLTDELAAWERVQARYLKGTEERKEADREVFRLRNELNREGFEHSKSWIDNEKNYNRLSLRDELAAWERVQKRYLVGTEERKEADKEVYRLKNEINEKLKSLNDDYLNKTKEANDKLIEDIKATNDEYERLVEDRTKSLTDFAGIFDEINNESKKDLTGDKLLSNLRGQVETFTNWSNNITILSSKNIDPDLLTTLREMGPSAAAEIAALNTLSAEELTEYSNLWKTKNAMAKHEALIQLEDQKIETEKKIEEMTLTTAEQLEQYKQEWIKGASEIKDGFVDQYVDLDTTMEEIGEKAMTGLADGLKNMMPELTSQAKAIGNAVSDAISDALGIDNPNKSIFSPILKTLQSISPIKSINSMLDGLALPSQVNEMRYSGISSTAGFDTSTLTKANLGIQPDTSYTTSTSSFIDKFIKLAKSGLSSSSTTEKTSGNTNNNDSLAKSIDNLASQPVVTKVYLDGQEIADVVSVRQSNEASITAITKGVVFD